MTRSSHTTDGLRAIMVPFVGQTGGILRAFQKIQEIHGIVPAEAKIEAANLFNISAAEVRGIVSFYHDFRATPAGKTHIRLCQAEACQAVGSRELTQHAVDQLGISLGETSPDGQLSLEPVYCLGLCACGPAMMIGDTLHGRVDAERFDTLVASASA
jgi:formate dehydrogenase subunit gamma